MKADKRTQALLDALDEIVHPLAYMRKRAEADGFFLSEMAHEIANSTTHLQTIASDALAAFWKR